MGEQYENTGYNVTYSIVNEWTGNQTISMSITNTGTETLRNWALKFDCADAEITNIWNAQVVENSDEYCIVRNNGYNYELIPGNTVEFGFQLQGENLLLPEDISLCTHTVDATENAEVTLDVKSSWADEFVGEISIKNISDTPLEAWRLNFNGNFEMSSIWNAVKLSSETGVFNIESDITTNPIATGETKTFGFQGKITSGEQPEITNISMTVIVIGDGEDVDSPEEHRDFIICYGDFDNESNMMLIGWYSTSEGAVTIYESTDGSDWSEITKVTENSSYIHEITDDFIVKYVKVKQETENGVIEAVPFVVELTDNGYVCTSIDSDEDKVSDSLEGIFGTDPNNPDTDGDGLSDYEEIYITGTNPLKYDTDENGVNDADDDSDGDGLSNKKELELGTSVISPDTDSDGLSDYDEVYVYSTDPLKADMDSDTLYDGDEIAIGLDPNNPETFGMPDAEYKVVQTVPADSDALAKINNADAPYALSVEITA